ncbi:RRM domain-containing protein [Nephila pilipes]|uniref:RRM domain-containing protein n=1 Tax=Nephila pilipes TaxID=299642 RepID=A0A8X6QBC0_NEPPI|nr:RRM domain-containing protein [Nephila pilipes]
MEAKTDSDHKNEIQHSSESSTSRSGQASSKSRNRKHKKRPNVSKNNWSKSCKSKDISDIEKEKNDAKDSAVAGPSKEMATALQQEIGLTGPTAPFMHQPSKPICTDPQENDMDHNQSVSAVKPFLLEDKGESAYIGKLSEDNAMAGDFGCRNNQMNLEEEQHTEADCSPNPPIPHYTDLQAASVNEKLCNPETFQEALPVLNAWLTRGECSESNSDTIFSMLQNVHNHVSKLSYKRAQCEDESERANNAVKNISRSLQEAKWQREILLHCAAAFPERFEEDMDMGRNENAEDNNAEDNNAEDNNAEDNNAEDYNDEDNNVHVLRDRLLMLRRQVELTKLECDELKVIGEGYEKEISKLKQSLEEIQNVQDPEICEVAAEDKSDADSAIQNAPVSNTSTQCVIDATVDVTKFETQMMCLISIFLNDQPVGADIDSIYSYLVKIHSAITVRDVDYLLRKFPLLFKEVFVGNDSTLEKIWKFVGFRNPP